MGRVWVSLLMVGAFLLVACGGDDNDAVTPTTSPQRTDAPATTTTPLQTEPATARATTTGTPTGVPAPTNEHSPVPDSSAAEQAARDALASWLGPVGDPASIAVKAIERLTWTNACLDLPRAGQTCAEVRVDGYRIEFVLANATYEVRTDSIGEVVRWAPETLALVRFAESSANFFAFTTDDGGTIEAQPVPGTSFGVDVLSLEEGDPVGIALVAAPQREGFLVIWIDPAE